MHPFTKPLHICPLRLLLSKTFARFPKICLNNFCKSGFFLLSHFDGFKFGWFWHSSSSFASYVFIREYMSIAWYFVIFRLTFPKIWTEYGSHHCTLRSFPLDLFLHLIYSCLVRIQIVLYRLLLIEQLFFYSLSTWFVLSLTFFLLFN